MTDPIAFDSTSPRFALPLLFAGQAQKEVFINEALMLVDGLLHCTVETEANTPPTTAPDGLEWLIGTAPTGIWAGHAGEVAIRQAGQWLFVPAPDGFALYDRATGQVVRRINGQWRRPAAPANPAGGSVVDTEARAALAALIAALRQCGTLPA